MYLKSNLFICVRGYVPNFLAFFVAKAIFKGRPSLFRTCKIFIDPERRNEQQVTRPNGASGLTRSTLRFSTLTDGTELSPPPQINNDYTTWQAAETRDLDGYPWVMYMPFLE